MLIFVITYRWNGDRMKPFPVQKIALVSIWTLNTYMGSINAANNSRKASLFQKALLYFLPFGSCWSPWYELVLFSDKSCWHPTDDSRNGAFGNVSYCVTYHLQTPTTCERTKRNKNLFLGFQCTVSSGWSFEVSSKCVGDELNRITQKSVAWLKVYMTRNVLLAYSKELSKWWKGNLFPQRINEFMRLATWVNVWLVGISLHMGLLVLSI